MKNKKIIYNNSIQKRHLNSKINKKLNKEYVYIISKIIKNLNKTKNNFHSLSNEYKLNYKSKDLNSFKKYKTVVVIGMGGSILGSEAIYDFLKGKIKKNFIFFDNIDKEKLQKIKNYNNLAKILFIIISKSGSTIETLSNLLALQVAKKNSKNLIIISEKKDNPLHLLSNKMNLLHIKHNNYVGGRYSVFSEASLVPAYLMGINIIRLRKNVLDHFKSKKQNFLKDSAIKMTNLLKKGKFKNIIFLNYIPKLDKFLQWNQQLIAESLGKKGRGFLPLISTAPKDHHSLLQLYLDGPKDKLFYIFCSNIKDDRKINSKILGKNFNFLNNKSLSQIKIAQKNALIEVFKKNNIPFREFNINDFSEEVLGELFSFFMLETSLIGNLAKINPFNQPAVDQVKINTKKILI